MKKEIISTPIAITESAVKELKKIMTDQQIEENYFLRLGVKSGGCSGFEYILGFDEKNDQDDFFTIDGLNVIIQQSHLMYLHGITLDYQSGLDNRGFIFNNPNAQDTCGCGSSFSA